MTAVTVEHLEHQLGAYLAVGRQITELTQMRERIRQSIEAAMGDNEEGLIGDRIAVRYTKFTQKRISPELLRKTFTEDQLAGCYVEIDSRRLTVIPP